MPRCRVDAAIPARKQLYSRLSKTFVARKFSRLTLFHGCFVQSTIRFPSLGRRCPPLSLSLSLPLTLFFLFVASSPTPRVSLARDTQMRPSILRSHCYSKCSLPIVTMAGHSWHCCRYCYYYHYCYRLRPTGEWRRGEPAASSSAALEANYTPSGPPSSLFFSFSLCPSRLLISFFLSYILDFTPFLSSKFRMVDRYRIRTKDAYRMLSTSLEHISYNHILF